MRTYSGEHQREQAGKRWRGVPRLYYVAGGSGKNATSYFPAFYIFFEQALFGNKIDYKNFLF